MLEWGLIHIFAGGITVYNAFQPNIPALLSGICSGAPQAIQDQATTVTDWNAMNVRILIQHGLNLFFVGVWALGIAVVMVTETTVPKSLFLACIWPWCADIAYWYAIDTVHYGEPMTEAQTIIVSIGTWCIGQLVLENYAGEIGGLQTLAMSALPYGLIACSVINKAVEVGWKKNEYEEL